MSLAHLRESFGRYWGVLVFGDVGTRSIPNLGNEPLYITSGYKLLGDFLGSSGLFLSQTKRPTESRSRERVLNESVNQ